MKVCTDYYKYYKGLLQDLEISYTSMFVTKIGVKVYVHINNPSDSASTLLYDHFSYFKINKMSLVCIHIESTK